MSVLAASGIFPLGRPPTPPNPVTHPTDNKPTTQRLAIEVRGVIQGVGFRPFVFNLAKSAGLTGWVLNEADAVRIEAQGPADSLEAFRTRLREDHPPPARIDSIDVNQIECEPDDGGLFLIRDSLREGDPRPTIPADLATCAECLEEIRSAPERRYGYAFTNCTNCGPRWSIIEELPYDRPRTSMAKFGMCADCQAEYADPTDRRFHAQPIACPECGPRLKLLDRSGRQVCDRERALELAAGEVKAGKILALKGLGGFQLVVDATNADAVALLRERKRRPDKPFAVMLSLLEEARRRCHVSAEEAEALVSHQAPIVLLRRRRESAPVTDETVEDIAPGVAPGNPYLGVMLPYTPLHHLFMAAVGRPIVCTSGNLAEEPMAIHTDDAVERLSVIADLFLVHDRPIVRPVDDSVARVGPGGLQVFRRARGFAPTPIDLGFTGPTVLAVGGHLKNTVALSLGSQAVMSPHVGDLDIILGVEVHRRAVRDLVDFFRARPEVVACDMHPDYASTRHAERLATEWNVPLVRVQHHHAHVAACRAENGIEGPLLGFSFDGTGYGPDGTVWGGEVLQCDGAEFIRVGHLRTFSLPGGDRAVREPRRSALGVLFELFGNEAADHARAWFEPHELNSFMTLLDRSIRCPRTSSLGRLFDAVACLCGLGTTISFEGQAAMALEYAADWQEKDAYPMTLSDTIPAVADWEPMVGAILEDRRSGVPTGRISARFHNALADWAVAAARRVDCRQVALSGGCFQNGLLFDRVQTRLLEAGFTVYTHRMVPPGDGGIALGQLLVAARRMKGC
jgi:hydrogenase maturation protein HypF